MSNRAKIGNSTVDVRNGTDEGAAVGAWVLLEAGQQVGVRRSGQALTPNVRNAELSA